MSAAGEPSYPKQAGNLKKGDYIVMKDIFPCKVTEISTSKTGKHGHAKCSITAVDIFTGKKYEDSCPSSHNVMCPNVSRTDYLLINIDDEYAFYFDQNDAEQQIRLPLENEELLADLRAAFEAGDKTIQINIQRAMNTEGIVAFKAETNK